MSDLINSITGRLRKYLHDRRRTLRRGVRFEAHLPLIISLLSAETDSAESLPNGPALVGFTRDLSEAGLTLLLPSVRIGDAYFTDRENYLGLKLELPGGPMAMLAVPVRFEQLSKKEAGCGYLLGVSIIKIQDGARDRYRAYLSTLEVKERRLRERKQVHTAAAITDLNSAAKIGAWDALTPISVNKAFEKFLREPTHPRES